MVDSLPRTVRLKLEQTLAQWQHWRCDPPLAAAPEVERILAPGMSNFSVLVSAGRGFVVRIDGTSPSTNGLNRQSEWRCLEAAHAAGLAPQPRYFNPELGSLVCDYLPPDAAQPLDLADIARLLRAIHRLPARHSRLDIGERLLRYERHLQQRDSTGTGDPLLAALLGHRPAVLDHLAQIGATENTALVLCHNDLLRANRIYSGGRLWAVDWEYSAMGSPWYDLAVVVAGDDLDEGQARTLLEAYLGRSAAEVERRALQRQGCVYRYLELLWYLAQPEAPLPRPALEEKLAGLARALSPGNW
jgi:thiamine kinase-like enzyme